MIVRPARGAGWSRIPWLTEQHESRACSSAARDHVCDRDVVLLVGMTLLLRTSLGVQLRASTEDFRMAQLVGVRANRVISSAFAITGLLASA